MCSNKSENVINYPIHIKFWQIQILKTGRRRNMTVTEVNGRTTNALNNAVKNVEKMSPAVKVEELINEKDEITLEDLAPDGGWGWMIALAMILTIVSIISLV